MSELALLRLFVYVCLFVFYVMTTASWQCVAQVTCHQATLRQWQNQKSLLVDE